MKNKNAQNVAKNIFKIIVTSGALYWVSRKIDFHELKKALIDCDWWYLFLAICSYSISILIASSRLNSFFKTIKLNLSERYNLRLYQLGLLYNFFLPGGIGGDGYKIYFLKKAHQIKGRKLLSAIFFDRLSGLWALAVIICALIVFMPRLAIPNYVTITAAFVGTGSYYFFLHSFFKDFARRFLQTHVKALAAQGFQVITAILILYSLNFDGKFSPYLLIFLVSSLVAIIPSIGGGVGLRELVFIYGTGYFQIEQHTGVLLSLFFYIISLVVACSGIYYIIRPQRLGADRLPSAAEVEKEIDKETLEENA
ncbi:MULTISPECIES: lysylphosphatidylglycerol synthase transmembrane domain-containing protein [Sphingobacterium]|uniref:lysylphosphatidylglycerol synthase transmembrane domain-containing protein n=1 Tax=Sphingobacterium TaxID=28453 RepID=UPI0013DAA9E3|nr:MULTISPECIES: lysylphosphatidylglycerol synthase transmembrane domain-containing protein [unclassified Sphingobacterium]